MLVAMLPQDEENKITSIDEKRIGVTRLCGGCKRKTLLEKTLPFYTEPKRALPTYRGRLIHSLIEDCAEQLAPYGWDLEMKLALPVTTKSGQWTLVGILDALDRNRGELYDNKTFQDYALAKMATGSNAGTWSDHVPDNYVKQLNIYRYMVEQTESIEIRKLRVQVITFGELVLTGTSPELKLKKGFKWYDDKFEIPDVPVLDNSIVENIIENEGDEWYRILYEGEAAPVREPDWAWLCKFCTFKGTKYCPDPSKEAQEYYT
jgi:hypothetical protein